ncbi:hypothetical protein D3877_07140 [Azospirillum cavernae]|uniref:WalW protein n=1 Tax=Azospirillum cavernae TaxID=2320860 RepID=A0A418W2S4_9PROT|nr:hypothetical protein [Azospirillum cavernae]RJF84330.1 hypothetical protein D3877_07140 [Azospirillum cavernae]
MPPHASAATPNAGGGIGPPPSNARIVFPADSPPQLLVFIDAEEEFDWSKFAPDQTSVRNIAEQHRAQRVLERFGCVPTYLVDYPVAAQPEGRGPLRGLLADGRCQIGAQLHPWVTPPFVHPNITLSQTFAGNLAPELERAKLANLTAMIDEGFGVKPFAYRAGRYGFGPNTAGLLRSLGYRLDVSVLAGADFRRGGGPCFRGFGVAPYWLDADRELLEIPLTSDYVGGLSRCGDSLYALADSRLGRAVRIPAVLARTGLLNRVRLSPEGQSCREAMALTLALLARGVRLFSVSYHSSSLLPGGNPYVPTGREVDRLIGWLAEYLEFFLTVVGGRTVTPTEIHRQVQRLDSP